MSSVVVGRLLFDGDAVGDVVHFDVVAYMVDFFNVIGDSVTSDSAFKRLIHLCLYHVDGIVDAVGRLGFIFDVIGRDTGLDALIRIVFIGFDKDVCVPII